MSDIYPNLEQPWPDHITWPETTATNGASELAPVHGSATGECPLCGRGTNDPIWCAVCRQEAVWRASNDLLAAGKAMLKSATPSAKEQPAMYAAWKLMQAAVEKAESPNDKILPTCATGGSTEETKS